MRAGGQWCMFDAMIRGRSKYMGLPGQTFSGIEHYRYSSHQQHPIPNPASPREYGKSNRTATFCIASRVENLQNLSGKSILSFIIQTLVVKIFINNL